MWSAKMFIIYLNQLQKMERETIMLNSVNNQFSLKKRKIKYLKVSILLIRDGITKSHDQVWGVECMTSAAEDCLGYSTTSWYIDTMIKAKLDLYYFLTWIMNIQFRRSSILLLYLLYKLWVGLKPIFSESYCK